MNKELFLREAPKIIKLLTPDATKAIAEKSNKKPQWVRKVLKAKGYNQEIACATIQFLRDRNKETAQLLDLFQK